MTRMYLMTRSNRYEKAAAGWYSCRGFIIGLEARLRELRHTLETDLFGFGSGLADQEVAGTGIAYALAL